MPLRNRVNPFGELIATPAPGLMFGNRGGRFHDANRELTGRPWRGPRWLICLTSFKGRQRQVWSTGYTELFFLDEVTALAAGHRPCAECRRSAARGFQAALLAAGMTPLSLDEIDARLDAERRDGRAKRLHRRPASELPDGAMIALGSDAFAIRGATILPWTPAGYGEPKPRPGGEVEVLTPPLTLAALHGGYAPLWHPSAAGR